MPGRTMAAGITIALVGVSRVVAYASPAARGAASGCGFGSGSGSGSGWVSGSSGAR